MITPDGILKHADMEVWKSLFHGSGGQAKDEIHCKDWTRKGKKHCLNDHTCWANAFGSSFVFFGDQLLSRKPKGQI